MICVFCQVNETNTMICSNCASFPSGRKRKRKIKVINATKEQEPTDLDLLNNIICGIRRKLWQKAAKRRMQGRTFKRLSYQYTSKYNKGLTPQYLWSLAKRQKMRCALTGRRLTKSDISLDHIIPKSRGGSHELSNLRLVTRLPNTFKNNSLDSELLALCKDIVRTLDYS